MGIWSDIKSCIKNSSLMLVMVFVCYIAFYAVNGERGIIKYMSLRQEISEAQKVAAVYRHQRISLEEKVKHLSNSSLDLDLLEERARIVLNMAAQDEFILLDEE
ncbi:MAG: septum formation initiator family protein [Alphaproteobacteria bacterium]|nr:septum formation initiator family protein [Alphaproteobacteria bacterium]